MSGVKQIVQWEITDSNIGKVCASFDNEGDIKLTAEGGEVVYISPANLYALSDEIRDYILRTNNN